MIYLLNAYFFVSILLLCYFYAKLLFHCSYYCITMCYSHVLNINRGNFFKRTQKHRQHYTVGNRHLFIAYFCIYLPIYYCFVLCMITFCFIFIIVVLQHLCRVYLQTFIPHYNMTTSKTRKRVGKICIPIVYFMFFCLLYYMIIFLNIVFISNCY